MNKVLDKIHELTRKLSEAESPDTFRTTEHLYIHTVYSSIMGSIYSNPGQLGQTLVAAECPYCSSHVQLAQGTAMVILDYMDAMAYNKQRRNFNTSVMCNACQKIFIISSSNGRTEINYRR